MNLKKILFESVIILCISIITALAVNSFSANGIALIYQEPDLEPGTHIDSQKAQKLLHAGRTLFIDTRDSAEFNSGHIPAAVNLPFRASMDNIIAFTRTLAPDRLIILYCYNEQCFSSRRMAGFLRHRGFTRVFVYLEGYEDWLNRGYPSEHHSVTGQRDAQ